MEAAESTSERRALSLVGQVVAERYKVEGLLGEGGMGTVLKATHLLLKQPVALKVMAEDAMPDPDLRARFLREARILAELKSKHIASLYDVGVLPDGSLYLAMEYLEGKDLGELAESAISPVRAVELGMQICLGLAEAHEKGVVHRDLKPSNVFVSKGADGKETVKLIDFGIAKQEKENDALGRTKTNLMMGSPYYMSPEQIVSSKSVDQRSDIWSFGVLMFQLLAGILPFYDESVGAILIRVHNQPTPALPPHVPHDLANVVYRCLAKGAHQRYATAKDVFAALAPLATLPNRPPPSDHLRAVQALAPHAPQRSPAPLMIPDPALIAALPHGHRVDVPIDSTPTLPDSLVDRRSSGHMIAHLAGRDTPSHGAYPSYRGAQDPTTDAAVAFAPTIPPPPSPHQKGLWVAVGTLALAVAGLAVALLVTQRPATTNANANANAGTGTSIPSGPATSASTPTTAVPSAPPSVETPAPSMTASAPTVAPSSTSTTAPHPSGSSKWRGSKPIPTKDPLAP